MWDLLASVGILHALIVTVEEFSIKQLDGNDCKDEVEEEVHDEDVEHILQRVDHTVKHCLERWKKKIFCRKAIRVKGQFHEIFYSIRGHGATNQYFESGSGSYEKCFKKIEK